MDELSSGTELGKGQGRHGYRVRGLGVVTSQVGRVVLFSSILSSSLFFSFFHAHGRARAGSWGCGEGKGEGGSGQWHWIHKLWSRHGEMVKDMG